MYKESFGHAVSVLQSCIENHPGGWGGGGGGGLLLAWINFDPTKGKYSGLLWSVGWNYLSIPKLQRLHHISLGMDK